MHRIAGSITPQPQPGPYRRGDYDDDDDDVMSVSLVEETEYPGKTIE